MKMGSWRNRRKSGLLLLSVLLLAPLVTCCQTRYLLSSAYSQGEILRKRVPLEKALRDSSLSQDERAKLQIAADARVFAEKQLGLKPTQNYTSFVKLDRPYVTYVVSASPRWTLEHHLWKYPIVGSMPYRGYFEPDGAKKEAASLEAEGLDTFVRGVSAYSTLGWFKDPILSSMLNYQEHYLVNTIIHETTHATIFFDSEADFNERLAVFIGNKGTELFYQAREGKESPTLKEIEAQNRDEARFSEFISAEMNELKIWYEKMRALGTPVDEAQRKARLVDIQLAFVAKLKPNLETDTYANFDKIHLNNARLMTYQLYVQDLSLFEKAFIKNGSDIPRFVQFLKGLEKSKDPVGDLSRL